MSDNPNLGYYKPSQGSLTGFDLANIPSDNPNIAVTGWSIEDLRRFLLNQSDINFPSNEWIQRIEEEIRNHENDHNNPHRVTLDQIVGDFVAQVLGGIIPGTLPDVPPFYSYDAAYPTPLGTIFPATYSSTNLYRQTAGGWLSDIASETVVYGTDYISNRPGLPLFSSLVNVTPTNWSTATGFVYNTTLSDLDDDSIQYPFTFKTVYETPITSQFGVNITSTQELQQVYTTSFFLYKTSNGGKVRIYQPSDVNNYCEVDLETGECLVYANTLLATTTKYVNDVIRVSVSYTSFAPTPDNRLRIVHINEGASGDGTRSGSLGRPVFSIAHPQTTKAALGQPVIKNLGGDASTSNLVLDFSKVGAPATLPRFILTMALTLYPLVPNSTVTDATVLSMGALQITRNQNQIRVSVNGNPVWFSTISEGYNVFTMSYDALTLIFKDLENERQVMNGDYPPVSTSSVSVGTFGGYLHHIAFYAQSDKNQVVEYLNNG